MPVDALIFGTATLLKYCGNSEIFLVLLATGKCKATPTFTQGWKSSRGGDRKTVLSPLTEEQAEDGRVGVAQG